jgi:hypothetical protein
MYAQFQNSYRRMEESLQRLTDSIAAYNPSPAYADDLLAADDAVNEDLERRTCQQCALVGPVLTATCMQYPNIRRTTHAY